MFWRVTCWRGWVVATRCEIWRHSSRLPSVSDPRHDAGGQEDPGDIDLLSVPLTRTHTHKHSYHPPSPSPPSSPACRIRRCPEQTGVGCTHIYRSSVRHGEARAPIFSWRRDGKTREEASQDSEGNEGWSRLSSSSSRRPAPPPWPGGRVRRRQLHVHTPSVVYRG